jgi:hypothetical protein
MEWVYLCQSSQPFEEGLDGCITHHVNREFTKKEPSMTY